MAELIVALDLPSMGDARELVRAIPELRWVKVGPVLFNRPERDGGAMFIRELVDRGIRVFLDQKWHDIPNTVRGAVTAAREMGVAMATLHTTGGVAMMRAGAEAAVGDPGMLLVGVTVLTSHSGTSFAEAVGRSEVDLSEEVGRLADLARAAGMAGVVCSPQEVELVARRWPDAVIVVPGIRRAGDAAGDQVRVAGPSVVVQHGGTHLVVGRPVIASPDPRRAYLDLMEEME